MHLFKKHNIALPGAIIQLVQLVGAFSDGVIIDVDNGIPNQSVKRVMSTVRATTVMRENSDCLIRVRPVSVAQSSQSCYVNSDFFFVAGGDTMIHLKADQLNEQIFR